MKIVPPSPTLVSDMKKIGVVMQGDWVKKAGPEGQALIDAFNKK